MPYRCLVLKMASRFSTRDGTRCLPYDSMEFDGIRRKNRHVQACQSWADSTSRWEVIILFFHAFFRARAELRMKGTRRSGTANFQMCIYDRSPFNVSLACGPGTAKLSLDELCRRWFFTTSSSSDMPLGGKEIAPVPGCRPPVSRILSHVVVTRQVVDTSRMEFRQCENPVG